MNNPMISVSSGPVFVTADELPPGANGLRIRTRLNHQTVQDASIDDVVFDLASLIATLSAAITLSFSPGDAPSGAGIARKPTLFMRYGDV